jgi:hypothetical protein
MGHHSYRTSTIAARLKIDKNRGLSEDLRHLACKTGSVMRKTGQNVARQNRPMETFLPLESQTKRGNIANLGTTELRSAQTQTWTGIPSVAPFLQLRWARDFAEARITRILGLALLRLRRLYNLQSVPGQTDSPSLDLC